MPKEIIVAGKFTPARFKGELGVSARRKDIWGTRSIDPYDASEKFTMDVAAGMRRDPTIRGAWRLISLMLLAHFGRFRHGDEEVEAFVNETLRAAVGWRAFMRALLSAIFYGFSVTECVWTELANGRWAIGKLAPRHPTTLEGGFVSDKHGTLLYAGQRKPEDQSGKDRIKLPMGKLVHWAFDAEFGDGETPEGESILAAAYRSWTSVKALVRLWNRAMEQGPKPLIMWPHGRGDMLDPESGQEEPKSVVLARILQQVESRSGVAFEASEEWQKPYVLANEHISPSDFERSVKYHDGKMGVAMLTPKMLMEEPEHATRAHSQTQYTGPFLENLQGMADQKDSVMTEQVCKRLVVLNFPGAEDTGAWVSDEIDPEQMGALADILVKLVTGDARFHELDWRKTRGLFPDYFVQPDEEGWEEVEAWLEAEEPAGFEPMPEPEEERV